MKINVIIGWIFLGLIIVDLVIMCTILIVGWIIDYVDYRQSQKFKQKLRELEERLSIRDCEKCRVSWITCDNCRINDVSSDRFVQPVDESKCDDIIDKNDWFNSYKLRGDLLLNQETHIKPHSYKHR